MFKTFKKVFVFLLVACTCLALVGCNKKGFYPEIIDPAKEAAVASINAKIAGKEQSYDPHTYSYFEDICSNGLLTIDKLGSKEFNSKKEAEAAAAAIEKIAALTVADLENAFTNAVKPEQLANGAYSYVAETNANRTKILAALEEYAVKYGLTGLTLFQEAGLSLYNDGVQLGTQTYIVGYGFGAISEGGITKPLSYEGMNPAYAMYYHSFESEDPANLNYGDDKGSVVGDLQYFAGSYFGTKMNESKDGYDWYCDLAKEKPVADFEEGSAEEELYENTGLSAAWKFEVKTGSELKYNTLTEKENLKKYNNREVAPEDYLTPYKLLWTQANGWARATDNHGSSSEIVGEAAYYNASADGFNEDAWENVGVKITEEGGKTILHIEFTTPCSQFYAMYQSSSSIYAPIPQEFIDDIGGADVFGKFDTENGLTPVDTVLSTGPFTVEKWQNDVEIVFKKNPLFAEEGRYNVEGIHLAILKGIATDKELGFKEFMAGKLSACGVPSTQLENFKGKTDGTSTTNPNVSYFVKQVNGGSTFKLNFNTLNQATWIKLFGKDGSVAQTAEDQYWECEPIMSNHDFYLGLSYALDRKGMAEKTGNGFSLDYFGDAYLSDPENGVTYNATAEHQAAVASLKADADHDGYDLEIARQYFKKAADACLEAGYYKEGDTIHIEIAWMYASDEEEYHNFIKKCFEDAFNDASVCDNKLTLAVDFWVGASWSDVYYNKLMVGQFDLGFGSISGNSLNPLNFFEVLKSDNSSGFTLNWGTDTSVPSKDLVWGDACWSFDSLWKAADQGGYFEDGVVADLIKPEVQSVTVNDDGSQTIVAKLNAAEGEGIEVEFSQSYIYGYDTEQNYDEDQLVANYDPETDTLTLTVSSELCAKYAAENLFDGGADAYCGAYHGIDVYINNKIAGVPSYDVCFTIQPSANPELPLPYIDFGE